ncbi:UNVERIFIED_CONTAM: hypothetical protein HDU68_001217 [Siphonaria sp. JEL0065]|nr:hypothetical protein HDU68_001217 [Siphonaria sp. JEL0065]
MSSEAPVASAETTPQINQVEDQIPAEDPVDRLKAIRERLLSLRKSPSESKEMGRLWKEVSGLIAIINAKRSENATLSEGDGSDAIIEDLAPMFIQFWSSKGHIAEHMYPVYVKLAKYKHTMEQLLETGLFTKAILKDLDHHIQTTETAIIGFKSSARVSATGRQSLLKQPVSVAERSDSPSKSLGPGFTLLESKLASCVSLLKELKEALAIISPFLLPIHSRLVEIKNDLQQLIGRRSAHAFSLAEVQMLQDELLEIDSARIDGSYLGKDGTVLPGQATVIWLLEQCYEDAHELLALREAISGENPLRTIYESLIRLKTKLDHLELVYKYTFKCDDLVPIQMELGKIDNMRVDGKFVDETGQVPEGQAVLHFLLHKVIAFVDVHVAF